MNQAELRHRIRANTHQDEHQAVTQLLHSNPLSSKARNRCLMMPAAWSLTVAG